MKKLSIIVLNWNGEKLLKKCLPGLINQIEKSAGVDLIVVDNGSTDGSKEFLKNISDSKKVRAIFNSKNLGFVGGNNVGINQALERGADYVMLLNNDVIIKNVFWEPLVEFLEKNKKVGIVGPKIYFAPGYEFYQDRYPQKDKGKVIWYAGGVIDWDNVYASHRGLDQVDRGQYNKSEETDFVSGCCFLARKEVWEEALLDEKYFLYYEDSDSCLRAKENGWKVFYIPQSKIWHMNASSSRCGGGLQDYFITRNRLLFGMRWVPLRTKLALLKESFRILMTGRKWQKIGVRDFYLARFKRGSWR